MSFTEYELTRVEAVDRVRDASHQVRAKVASLIELIHQIDEEQAYLSLSRDLALRTLRQCGQQADEL